MGFEAGVWSVSFLVTTGLVQLIYPRSSSSWVNLLLVLSSMDLVI